MTTHEHAVEVDTKLAALWERQQVAGMKATSAINSLHSALGHKYLSVRKGQSPYAESAPSTILDAREIAARRDPTAIGTRFPAYIRTSAGEVLATHIGQQIERALADLDAATADRIAATAAAEPLEDEYRANRWSRFFLVVNTGGHVHSSMHCSTTFPTTSWAWLPELSGLTEDAAVAAQGPRLCSVCFPSAPVEWTLGLPKKLNPNQCEGSSKPALNVSYRYQTPRGTCSVCGTGVAASRSTGLARPHNKPKGA